MSIRRPLGTDMTVFPLALGGNVFGWTANPESSAEILDSYVAGGGNVIDTADSYSFWLPGHVGGESETIIGSWLAGRTDRENLVIATKVSQHPQFKGMAPVTIHRAIDASLRRLNTDTIDIYYAHYDDATIPLEDSIAAMSGLVDAGKIRSIGVSNYSPERLTEWLSIAEREGFHKPIVLQPQYNLVERGIEHDVVPVALSNNLKIMPYFGLAHGFLTGKYQPGAVIDSPRSDAASAYLVSRGFRVLDALKHVAQEQEVSQAAVALAWLAVQPGVIAPVASARNTTQLQALLESATVSLTSEQLALLSTASS